MRLHDDGMVVAQRQRPGTGQAVDEHAAVGISHVDAPRLDDGEGQTARVRAGVRLDWDWYSR